MLFEFDPNADQQAKLRVVGVGGAGGNAVNRMIQSGMQGVDFIAINTDAQDLENNAAEQKIQIGKNLTKGLGAGAKADIGKAAMEADKEAITAMLEGSDMVFITAGMGGGTGTGAAPVIGQISKELGILTVGIITLPFNFEGPKRMNRAANGIEELRKTCDTVIGIPNQKLMSIVDKSTTVVEAFLLADSILNQATKGISDLINVHGLINLDFADVETIMKNMGDAIMGTGQASGEERAVLAAQQAISSPLLDNASISGAQGVLVNITGGPDLTLMEVDDASGIIFEEAGQGVNLIFGAVIDPTLTDEIRVTVIATGFNHRKSAETTRELVVDEDPPRRKETHILSEQMNVPLHKKEDEAAEPAIPEADPVPPKVTKENAEETVIYGSDLDIPAFIRRQHE